MAVPHPSISQQRGHGVRAGLSTDVEREAGRLALLMAERAGAAGDPLATAEDVLALLIEELAASVAALYRRRGHAASSGMQVELVAALGSATRRVPTLDAIATQVLAEGRLAVLPVLADDPLPGEQSMRVLVLPLGKRSMAGALALGWPLTSDGEMDALRSQLIIRLAPALALALRPALNLRHGALHGGRASANDDGTSLLSLMAHELRTPLNTMNGFVEIVLDGLAGPLTDRQREFLRYAHDSTRHLIRLIEDLLLVSRAEGHHLALHREPIDAVDLAVKAFAAAREAAARCQIAFVLEAEPNLPLLVGDAPRLIQALSSVLRFLAARAPAASAVHVVVTADEHATTFSAADLGSALSAAELERLCEPRRPCPGSESGVLTGLELAIARLITEHHGGGLMATHNPEGGFSLRLTLPLPG
jgi:signal transduction histidine kinase